MMFDRYLQKLSGEAYHGVAAADGGAGSLVLTLVFAVPVPRQFPVTRLEATGF